MALSTASRRLADFDATAGMPLLEPSAQGVRLTPAGHVPMQHSLRLCHGLELFDAELAEFSHGFRGHVRLRANMSALNKERPDALATFMTGHSEIKVEIE